MRRREREREREREGEEQTEEKKEGGERLPHGQVKELMQAREEGVSEGREASPDLGAWEEGVAKGHPTSFSLSKSWLRDGQSAGPRPPEDTCWAVPLFATWRDVSPDVETGCQRVLACVVEPDDVQKPGVGIRLESSRWRASASVSLPV